MKNLKVIANGGAQFVLLAAAMRANRNNTIFSHLGGPGDLFTLDVPTGCEQVLLIGFGTNRNAEANAPFVKKFADAGIELLATEEAWAAYGVRIVSVEDFDHNPDVLAAANDSRSDLHQFVNAAISFDMRDTQTKYQVLDYVAEKGMLHNIVDGYGVLGFAELYGALKEKAGAYNERQRILLDTLVKAAQDKGNGIRFVDASTAFGIQANDICQKLYGVEGTKFVVVLWNKPGAGKVVNVGIDTQKGTSGVANITNALQAAGIANAVGREFVATSIRPDQLEDVFAALLAL